MALRPVQQSDQEDGCDRLEPVVELDGVSRSFEAKAALRDVSLSVAPGETHAILGPNGAGKTTLIRILVGLTRPDSGRVRFLGQALAEGHDRDSRRLFGVVPSGDRSLYLRLTGLENLVFFARLYGMPRRRAEDRARECLQAVDLADVADQRSNTYSHGMQKRLAIARALLTTPSLLVFDEATHDLDPVAARQIQDLVRAAALTGTAVLWATQRVEEIRGFAEKVTLLDRGSTRFSGSVPELMAHGLTRRYLMQLTTDDRRDALDLARVALGASGSVVPSSESPDSFLVRLGEEAVLGDAIAAMSAAGLAVTACRQERPEVEDAFLSLTKGSS